MAKRKRLTPAFVADIPKLETKSDQGGMQSMPIADVVGDTAVRAALEEVAGAMALAEDEGRVIKKLPLDQVEAQHLNRDRLVMDAEDFDVLKSSIAARGQQTPVEVLQLPDGRFGLISGLRRIEALKALGQDTCLALVRWPDNMEAAYVAMIEENEIRSDLSFYERANVAVQAVNAGIYPTPARAVKSLFAASASAKRSKILKFVVLHSALAASLKYPAAIPEKLGLALATTIETDQRAAGRISAALRSADVVDAAAERQVLERALKTPQKQTTGTLRKKIGPGIALEAKKSRVVLSGPGVDAELTEALVAWLTSR